MRLLIFYQEGDKMKKEKFEAKCQELYAYEDEMYAKMQEYIKPYNEKLNKQGLEIVCTRFWFCEENNEVIYKQERKTINYKKYYSCMISLQYQRLGANEDSENEPGFQLFDRVTAYGISIFKGWSLNKYKVKFLFKNIKKHYYMVLNMGIEKSTEIFKRKHKIVEK